nr:NO-inducible flavohemoprotein [Peribacillus kribbensis]
MLSQQNIDIIKSTAPVLAVKGTEITTVFYKNLFKNHPELLHIFNHTNQEQGRQQTALANVVYAAAVHIDQLEALLPAVKQIAQKHRSLQVKPEHYPIVGEHLLQAIKKVLGDAATDEILHAWGEAYGIIADVFISVEKDLYKSAAEKDGGWDGFKNFTVADKVKESDVITSFYLKPTDRQPLPDFKPGQYVTVRLQIEGEEYLFNRQYSLSDAPGRDYFRISVKRETGSENPDGKVSNFLHDQINVGDQIELTAPAGEFTLDLDGKEPVYFISGGVGITPFISMLNSMKTVSPERETVFIHSAKNKLVHAFSDEVQKAEKELTNFKSYCFYGDAAGVDMANEDLYRHGRITKSHLREIVKAANSQFYLCGPASFLKSMINALKEIGVEDSNIHYEFFGPSLEL